MPSVFKIYILDISDGNLVWQSDRVSENAGYGDSILSPKLKKEINKADGFDFMILPSNRFYDSFEKKKTFVFLTRDGKCIFRGRVSDIKTDIFKQRTINCEGDLAFLADSVQSPNKRTDTSKNTDTGTQKRNTKYYGFDGSSSDSDSKIKMKVKDYFEGLIGEHNAQVSGYSKGFTVGTISVSKKNNTEKFERTSFQDTSSVISSDLLSVYGGVLRTRFENNTAYIDWLDDYTSTSEQEIRFGVNLIELNQEPPSDGVWSVLLPVGDDNLTIEKVNGSMYLSTSELLNAYGYIVHYHQFNDVKDATELKSKAEQYLSTHGKVFPDNIVVKAVDLQLIGESNDPLELGEKIKVISEPHGLNKTMSCIAMELDIYNPENNSYTIGTIMPPDKEKKKDSLSSQHAESSSSHARGIANNANKIGKLNEDINVNANNINVNAQNIAVNAEQIDLRVEKDGVIASIIASPEEIGITADRIVFNGTVLSTHLESLYGQFTNLVSGTTIASKIYATDLKAVTGALDIGDDKNTGTKLRYHGYEYTSISIKLPNVQSYPFLGYTSGSETEFSLAHSHSVTTNSDGTITLGGTVATNATNRSFRIADTKTYKDGVSAARSAGLTEGFNSVTVSSLSINSVTYNSGRKRYDTTLLGYISNGKSSYATTSIDASDAYNSGKNSVTVWEVTAIDVTAVQGSSGRYNHANITLKVELSNGKEEEINLNSVDMWQVYNQGGIDAVIADAYLSNYRQTADLYEYVDIEGRFRNRDTGNYGTYRRSVQLNAI